jgi:hypothetical protein
LYGQGFTPRQVSQLLTEFGVDLLIRQGTAKIVSRLDPARLDLIDSRRDHRFTRRERAPGLFSHDRAKAHVAVLEFTDRGSAFVPYGPGGGGAPSGSCRRTSRPAHGRLQRLDRRRFGHWSRRELLTYRDD